MKKKIVLLNNKSRKGEYVYIKENGKQARYYKVPENTTKKDAYKAAEIHYGITKVEEKSPNKKIKQQRVKPINDTIKAGITKAMMKNILVTSNTNKKQALEELMKNAKTEEDRKMLIQEANQQKIKHRYEHEIEFQDAYGQVLFRAKAYNKTINEVEKEVNEIIKTGQTYEVEQGEYASSMKKKMEKVGIKITEEIMSGNIDKARLTSTFRKLK